MFLKKGHIKNIVALFLFRSSKALTVVIDSVITVFMSPERE